MGQPLKLARECLRLSHPKHTRHRTSLLHMHISLIRQAAIRHCTGLRAIGIGVCAAFLATASPASSAEWTSLNVGKLNDSGIFSTVFAHRSDGRFLLGSQGALTLQKTFGSAAQSPFKTGGLAFDPSFLALRDDSNALLGQGGFFGPSGLHSFQPSSPAIPISSSPLATLQNYAGAFWRHPSSGREGWLIAGGNGTGGMHNITFVSLDGSHVGAITSDLSTYSAGMAVGSDGALYAALYELDGSPNAADADKVLKFSASEIDAAVAAVIAGSPAPAARSNAALVHQFSSASAIAVDSQQRVWATGWKISAIECFDPATSQTRSFTPDHPTITGAAGPAAYQVQTFSRNGINYVAYLATDSWGTPGTPIFYGYKPEAELTVPQPVLEFASSAQTVAEDAGNVQVTVTLSTALQTRLSVAIQVAGTAIAGTKGDFTLSALPLIFDVGETSKTISIQVRDDSQEEPSPTETVILTLANTLPGAQTVQLGGQSIHTLTITDNDEVPEVVSQTGDVIVSIGSTAVVSPTVTGSATLAFQWERARRRVSGQTLQDLSLSNASLNQAGRYRVRISNPAGAVYGPEVDVAVIDSAAREVRALPNRDALITVPAMGVGLKFSWTKDGSPIADGSDFSGTTTSRLRVRRAEPGDEGVYRCRVETLGGASLTTDPLTLWLAAKPVAAVPVSLDLPAAQVGAAYTFTFADYDAEDHVAPTRFTATGLPAGLRIDAATGIISGRPTIAGTRAAIYITASNIAGGIRQGPYRMIVNAYDEDALGSFAGFVDRAGTVTGPTSNEGLGARVDLATTRSAAYSGRVTIGSRSYAFRGLLDTASANPQGAPLIKLSRSETLALTFSINAETGALTGSVADLGTSATLTGWRCLAARDPSLAARLGSHHFFADVPGGPLSTSLPEGTSFASASVTSSGTTVISGRTATGDAIVGSSRIGTGGEVLLYRTLDAGRASFFGQISIAADAAHTLTGALTWSRLANPRSLIYPAGWSPPVALQARGGLYTPASTDTGTGITMGLNATALGVANAFLEFLGGGVESSSTSPATVVRISSTAAVSPITPNPNAVSLKIRNSNGSVTGSFVLTDGSIHRKVAFQGLIVPNTATPALDDGLGYGWFLLPELPGTSRDLKRSGLVLLGPNLP